eukprot:Em0009g1062a
MESDLHTFKRLALKPRASLKSRDNSRDGFWNKYTHFPVVVKEHAPVTSINFSPAEPYEFAVTTGGKVNIYSSADGHVARTISKFEESAYGARFRADGKLLAAGSEKGVVKVFETSCRSVLRQYTGHAKAAKAVCFLDAYSLASGSDDTTLRCWELSTEACTAVLKEHEDYVRCVVVNPSSANLLFSGSYDHTVRMWDLRTQASVLQLDHGAPVESVVVFPSGGMCISAGANYIKIWDILSGGRSLGTFSNHQKTITSLAFDGTFHHVITGSLDRLVKIYSVEDYRVVHSMTYPAPVLSLAVSATNSHIVVGMTTKLLSIRRQPRKKSAPISSSLPIGGSYRYFVRGKKHKPSLDEFVVAVQKKQHLQPYEKLLKRFKYRKALGAALLAKESIVAYSLLQELARRDGLNIAVSGLNEDELCPLLKYLCSNVTNPHYAAFLLDICNLVIDIYGVVTSQSTAVRALFNLLRVKIEKELEFQKNAFQLLGAMDLILTTATVRLSGQQLSIVDKSTTGVTA